MKQNNEKREDLKVLAGKKMSLKKVAQVRGGWGRPGRWS